MSDVDRMIAAFRNEDTASLSDPDVESYKDTIISTLEDYLSNPKVVEFFMAVAADATEYDMARIEVFKIFYIKYLEMSLFDQQIGHVIAQVLLNDNDDDDVKNYAAIAAASYMANPLVEETIEKIVLDPKADPNLRANAFDAVARSHQSPKRVHVVQSLIHDGQFGQSASRLLDEWNANP